ncbi:hypothetical protein Y032_0415g1073 [Ancylostoma ceylanicum]|uniref:Uncharacterized protein n=1 Tax=Ancylostoma ceylanicum TaxID=53326 RepID=A0A016X1W5_9BILA|nr:hypothetical protein Y032_0415g1073 [Ancylostoma ceylanicum]
MGKVLSSKCLDIGTVLAILHALAELLNYRCNTSVRRSILTEFFRCMAVHGVPFRYVLESRVSRYLAREAYNEKYPPSMNIMQFFCDLSELEYGLRVNVWSFHTIQMGSSVPQRSPPLHGAAKSTVIGCALRDQRAAALCAGPAAIFQLSYARIFSIIGSAGQILVCIYKSEMTGNVPKHVSPITTGETYLILEACQVARFVKQTVCNSEIIRMTSETIEERIQGWREMNYQVQKMIYFDSPIAFFMTLQSTLKIKHGVSFHVGNRLAMLASMQAMIYTTTAAKNTILMQLCEVLIAAMLCGDLSNVSTILALEHQIHRYNKGYDNAMVWNAYKLIAEYEEWRGRTGFGGMILNTAQSLSETAEGMSAHGALFLETACRIWAKNGRCEDRIAAAVSRIVQTCPQLLRRITVFLKEIDYDDEVEITIEEVCNMEDSSLHPSDPAWLKWCQPRVERPERYGKRTSVLTRCVNVLFRFLDYGSNRGNGQAWVLLHTAVQIVDQSLLTSTWAARYDWWPRFHTVSLPREAESLRSQLLAALLEMPLE